jgi:hypothetical protein
MKLKFTFIILLSTVTGAITALMLNFLIIQNILIPDPCYYHSHETGKLFDIFYEMTAAEGYHPLPTRFNLIFTILLGALSGLFFSICKIRKGAVPGLPAFNTNT